MTQPSTPAVDMVPIGAGRGGRYWGRFYSLLAIAAIVATIGLNANSGAVVIAAMLLAPLMEPILGIASNLVLGTWAVSHGFSPARSSPPSSPWGSGT